MLRSNLKITKFSIAAFLLVELVLGILIQVGINEGSNYLRFASVVIAFIFSLLLANRSIDSMLVGVALLFTVCADYCLVIMSPAPKILAMVFFNVVQLLYFARILLSESDRRMRLVNVSLRSLVIVAAVIITVIVLGDRTDALSIISIVYFADLAVNIIFAFVEHKRFLLFAIGLVCFACCDIFVGLSVLVTDYISTSQESLLYTLTHTKIDMVWLFYVPSQTLIAISNLKRNTVK